MRVLNKALRLLKTLLGALDQQEVLFSSDGDRAEVKLVLRPEIGVERGAAAGSIPEFFGIGKKDFEEWKGLRQRPRREPIGRWFRKAE